MMKAYELEDILNAIYIPFGFNSSIYLKKDLGLKYDVSFVGGFSSLRKWIINQLLKEGIKVNVFGRGWGSGIQYIPIEKMVDVFNQSYVNLNLSNGINRDVGLLMHSIMSPKAMKHILFNKKNKEQVKGRHFEINGCGGFQLSYFVPGLNLYYEIDKQIAVYEDIYSLPSEIKFFLKRRDIREEIATNGYLRSVNEHSAQGYLAGLIKTVFKAELS
jgi:spore maturation protein CgeB